MDPIRSAVINTHAADAVPVTLERDRMIGGLYEVVLENQIILLRLSHIACSRIHIYAV